MSEAALINIEVGKPKTTPNKLTAKKRKQFLEYYAKTGNFSMSALQIGLARQSVYELIKRDDKFANAFQFIDDHITDAIEQISLTQSLQATRDSFPDRKLQLTARRPEKYGNSPQVQINQQINIDNPEAELKTILSQAGLPSK